MLRTSVKKESNTKPLGEILQEADLLSSAQIQVALQDQSIYQNMRIGEILVLRGWIEQKTVDFFAENWCRLLKENHKKPIGYYFREAGLLSPQQVQMILFEQRQKNLKIRFGKLAVEKGWLTRKTVNFFLENLSLKSTIDRVFIGRKASS